MRLKKIIYMIIIMLTLSYSLQAMGHRNMSQPSSMISDLSIENLTPEQNEKVMDLRGEFVQREIQINREIRMLRMELHGCMRREKIDLEDYQRIEKESQKLREERETLQIDYNKQILELIETF